MAETNYNHLSRTRGDIIRASEWNAMGEEVERLESAKVNRAGDTIGGPLEVSGAVTATYFDGVGSSLRQLNANEISSGTLNVNRIPNLPASKMTSGTLDVDRIPNLPASKMTSGTLDVDRIPNLPASKITALQQSPWADGRNRSIYYNSGNVGINTLNPEALLDINGTLRVGGGTVINRIIFGAVNLAGQVESGTGFSCESLNRGLFRITFDTPFSSKPYILRTINTNASYTFTVKSDSGSGEFVDVATVYNARAGLVNASVGFVFMAVGYIR